MEGNLSKEWNGAERLNDGPKMKCGGFVSSRNGNKPIWYGEYWWEREGQRSSKHCCRSMVSFFTITHPPHPDINPKVGSINFFCTKSSFSTIWYHLGTFYVYMFLMLSQNLHVIMSLTFLTSLTSHLTRINF